VHNHLLVIHQKDYIVKFSVEEGHLVKRSEVKCVEVHKYQNSQPVVVGGVVFMMCEGKCVLLNTETGAEVA